MSKKITIQQIADAVGVSKFAVSKALSGKSGVSQALREKIIQTAHQMGYKSQKIQSEVRDRRAESASEGRDDKRFVAVLFPNVRYQIKESLYWGKVLDGVVRGLQDHRFGMITITEHTIDNFAKIIDPKDLLGIIGIGWASTSLLLEVRGTDTPFVLVDHEDAVIDSDTLFINNFDCMKKMTHYLLGLGHRKMQFIGNIQFSRSFSDRWIGYRTALEESEVPVQQSEELLKLNGEAFDVILDVLTRKFNEGDMPTALVCANDAIALMVMDVLKHMNLRVPQDCSVTGFDNNENTLESGLTTINVTKEILGLRAVQTLLWRLDNPDFPIEKILLSGDLMIRASTAASSR
ncbi:LacI family DNA-binding transcriptional regulator [Paenibacillus spongiae]|uniref:LacI family DNA-binding transcriptional regulator n=1 Tax=Paenibacillus spongiae TaxID=2909671 RepID=A0ABY5SEN1_9BACL|nr:LacI family DNA-binding transcriptional regulator [Paenibacillus spongiae]UVI31988.1 LacI family DNA-binding transcriptional regulator [Paenibacillus spongiae]